MKLLLAICRSILPLLIFLASSWNQKAKIGLGMSLRNKKMINYHIKGLSKTKTKSNFSHFFFPHWLLHKHFSLSLSMRFHRQVFTVYINGENLKMLIEIFCQRLIDSNVILTFLDHLKPKVFFVANIEYHPCSKSLDPPL